MTDWVMRETRQTGATGQLSSHNKDQGMRLFCPARPSLQVPIRESETRLFACVCSCVSVRVCHSVCVYVCVCVRLRYLTTTLPYTGIRRLHCLDDLTLT